MEQPQQIDIFAKRLDDLVSHTVKEFDLTYAQVIGTLELKIFVLSMESYENNKNKKDGK